MRTVNAPDTSGGGGLKSSRATDNLRRHPTVVASDGSARTAAENSRMPISPTNAHVVRRNHRRMHKTLAGCAIGWGGNVRVLLLVSAFNGLTQRAWCVVRQAGH